MNISFDLISDLHVKDINFNWEGQATSQFCVVLGNVSADRAILKSTLAKLARCYMLVMYVDGNLEFANGFDNPDKDYKKFKRYLSSIPNLNYLYDNIVVLNDVAFIGVNGWWNFDFADPRDQQQIIDWYTQSGICPRDTDKILETARNDVTYLLNSIKKLQHNHNVKSIVVCTHTVPRLDLIEHDIALNQSLQIHVMGNQWLNQIKQIDVTKKIHTWVFGHYHSPVDRILDQIRYVNNSRGDQHSILLPYYPKKIFID